MTKTINKKTLRNVFELFLISFLCLFLELAIIRWTPGTVSAMSYFTNLVLIASFLGLGLGCAIAKKEINLIYLPALFVFFISVAMFFKTTGVSAWINITDLIFLPGNVKAWPMYLAIPIMFFLIFTIFIPIGVILGRCLDYFRPLISYSINIAASIIGIGTFTLLSFGFIPPHIWFLIGFIGLFWFLKKHALYTALSFTSCILLISLLSAGQTWSPYYKIEASKQSEEEFFRLTVNNDYQQQALDLSLEKAASSRGVKHWKDIYNLPYLFTQPKKILIVGSGLGNDVLLATYNSIPKIDAVEIDPGIISFGRLRPDNPYGNKNTQIFIDDARSFMNKSKEKYDLIVYGFLDSHALFANMASVRLDNFVYTLEGIRQAKSLLTKEGSIALSFFVGKPWVGNKIYYMLKKVFHQKPLVYRSKIIPTEQIFFISLDTSKMLTKDIPDFTEISTEYESAQKLPLPSDDWPYFYLQDKSIPFLYLAILAIIFFICVAGALLYLPKNKNILPSFCFFFLGAAFMLIETKGIVQLSLIFGTTWLVNSIVITGILIMILLANLCIFKLNPKKLEPFYILLAISLLLNWFFGPKDITIANQFFKILGSVFLVTIPVFFAAIIFAVLFKDTKDMHLTFGMNLLGAVLGGFLEYLSLVIGLNNLALIALFLYFLSFLTYRATRIECL